MSALDFAVNHNYSFFRRRRVISMISMSPKLTVFLFLLICAQLVIYFSFHFKPNVRSEHERFKARGAGKLARQKPIVPKQSTAGVLTKSMAVRKIIVKRTTKGRITTTKSTTKKVALIGTMFFLGPDMEKLYVDHKDFEISKDDELIGTRTGPTTKTGINLKLSTFRNTGDAKVKMDKMAKPAELRRDKKPEFDSLELNHKQGNVDREGGKSVGNKGKRMVIPSVGLTDRHNISMTGVNRVLHLIWRSMNIPDAVSPWLQRWPKTNAALKIAFWDHAAMKDTVSKLYKDFLPAWMKYKFDIDKIRAFQVLMLYKLGGVYSDIDVVPLAPLKGLINMYPCILSHGNPMICEIEGRGIPTGKSCVSMHFMACRAKHPFLHYLIELYKSVASRYNCSTRAGLCTGENILANAVRSYTKAGGNHRIEDQVFVASSDYFSSTFDPKAMEKIKIYCKSNENSTRCQELKSQSTFENKPGKNAYVVRRFLGSPGFADIKDGSKTVYDILPDARRGEKFIPVP